MGNWTKLPQKFRSWLGLGPKQSRYQKSKTKTRATRRHPLPIVFFRQLDPLLLKQKTILRRTRLSVLHRQHFTSTGAVMRWIPASDIPAICAESLRMQGHAHGHFRDFISASLMLGMANSDRKRAGRPQHDTTTAEFAAATATAASAAAYAVAAAIEKYHSDIGSSDDNNGK
ncbi:hypothetical protein CONLIGDRAFT_681771 [Coniochaeta ligniaria NRRL 30616]|uniref:Uncharacterized protein n=1 Tax=Coniochaeta ligniaria NRRL 30616 TaxID=1408157 RepID=A0A1J7JGH5_9PEZI|nr:hypothetical protein CONLIGDRAFT_681771 [Coniochaeta ligniaria NRRL 30616]